MNANKHGSLYRYDMRPVYRASSTNNHWVRIRTPVRIQKDEEGSPLSFEHLVDTNPSNTTISFAFTYPYSYTTLQQELQTYLIENQERNNHLEGADGSKGENGGGSGIYYTQELLTHSCDHLRVDLLTITSCTGWVDEHEPCLPDLFPELLTPSSQSLRPHLFPHKEIVFISARVHPGEVPAQHTLRGILNFLLDENDLRAKELRKRYVFKIVPMLNPDGALSTHSSCSLFDI
jgi:cytosolic carboxypeptidase protein 5